MTKKWTNDLSSFQNKQQTKNKNKKQRKEKEIKMAKKHLIKNVQHL